MVEEGHADLEVGARAQAPACESGLELLGEQIWTEAFERGRPRLGWQELHQGALKQTATTGTVGLRMPAGSVAQALLAAFGGPIIGTSANKTGGPDPADAKTVQRAVGGQIDLVLDGDRVALGVPSTVIDCTQVPARILREGAVSKATLAEKMLIA